MCYNWCTCLLKYITRGKHCQSRFYKGGSQPMRNIASTVLEFGLQLYKWFLFTNNSLLRKYFSPIFVPEFVQKDTTNTSSSTSYLELQPEK
jgi:hypothetical protein